MAPTDQTTPVTPGLRTVYQWPPPTPPLHQKNTLEALGQSEHLSSQEAKRGDPLITTTDTKPSGSQTADLKEAPELLPSGLPLKALDKAPQTSGPSLPSDGPIHTGNERLSDDQTSDAMNFCSQEPSRGPAAPDPYFGEIQGDQNMQQRNRVRTLVESVGDLAHCDFFSRQLLVVRQAQSLRATPVGHHIAIDKGVSQSSIFPTPKRRRSSLASSQPVNVSSQHKKSAFSISRYTFP